MMLQACLIVVATALIRVAPIAAQAMPADQPPTGRTPASDSAFHRAMTLINDGHGAEGRAVLDSMVLTARPGSPEYAEALYWRATVAPDAATAERDYRRVIVDHPLSPRIPESLLRLAQLELARGDREAALQHLQRLDVDHPTAPNRARTSYWVARVLLEQNDLPRGCAAVADARARLAAQDIELRNQIEYLAQRCPVTPAVAAVSPSTSGPAPLTPSAPSDVRPSVPRETTAATSSRSPAPATRPPAAAASTRGTGGSWSVQVAAFAARAQAAALVTRLSARGLDARVDGTVSPFRVRVGRFPTRAAAAAALRAMEAQGIDGFVTSVATR